MKKIVGKRGIGKTKELIEFAVDNECIILSANDDNLREKVVSMGYSPMMVMPFTPHTLEIVNDKNLNVVIDDIDLCMIDIFKERLKGYTLTID